MAKFRFKPIDNISNVITPKEKSYVVKHKKSKKYLIISIGLNVILSLILLLTTIKH